MKRILYKFVNASIGFGLKNLGYNMRIIKDELLHPLHDDHPHVLVELVYLHHVDGILEF